MIIRQVYGKRAKPAPLQRVRQWAQTPTGCKTCDQVRSAIAARLPAGKKR